MSSKNTKDTGQYIRKLAKEGWEVSRASNNHWSLVSPIGKRVFFSATPGDYRALDRLRMKVRKALKPD